VNPPEKYAMRAALFTDSDAFAGTERHIIDLARSMAGRDLLVSIACPQSSPLADRASALGLHVIPIPKRGKFLDRNAIRTLRRLLRSGQVDIIHAHNGRTALAASIAVRLAGRGRCVVTQHFLEPSHAGRTGPKGFLSRVAHGWVDRHTHAHIAISSAVRDSMIARGESAPAEVTVVRNGISPPDPSALTPAAQIRDELGVPRDATFVVCASRLEPEKDLMSLLEAMPLLHASPTVKLVIAGAGSMETDLRNRLRDWQLGDCCSLLGFREDVLSIIAAGDLFVLPSKAEPFGLVILEAMALAKPVVATAAGGPLEIVLDDVSGMLVPPNNPAALAAAMQQLINNPPRRAAMGQSGRERFENHFTADRMGRDTLDLYRSLLGLPAQEPDENLTEVADTATVH
jgi:glycosyltransferase involved in cell wall biosynthesis